MTAKSGRVTHATSLGLQEDSRFTRGFDPTGKGSIEKQPGKAIFFAPAASVRLDEKGNVTFGQAGRVQWYVSGDNGKTYTYSADLTKELGSFALSAVVDAKREDIRRTIHFQRFNVIGSEYDVVGNPIFENSDVAAEQILIRGGVRLRWKSPKENKNGLKSFSIESGPQYDNLWGDRRDPDNFLLPQSQRDQIPGPEGRLGYYAQGSATEKAGKFTFRQGVGVDRHGPEAGMTTTFDGKKIDPRVGYTRYSTGAHGVSAGAGFDMAGVKYDLTGNAFFGKVGDRSFVSPGGHLTTELARLYKGKPTEPPLPLAVLVGREAQNGAVVPVEVLKGKFANIQVAVPDRPGESAPIPAPKVEGLQAPLDKQSFAAAYRFSVDARGVAGAQRAQIPADHTQAWMQHTRFAPVILDDGKDAVIEIAPGRQIKAPRDVIDLIGIPVEGLTFVPYAADDKDAFLVKIPEQVVTGLKGLAEKLKDQDRLLDTAASTWKDASRLEADQARRVDSFTREELAAMGITRAVNRAARTITYEYRGPIGTRPLGGDVLIVPKEKGFSILEPGKATLERLKAGAGIPRIVFRPSFLPAGFARAGGDLGPDIAPRVGDTGEYASQGSEELGEAGLEAMLLYDRAPLGASLKHPNWRVAFVPVDDPFAEPNADPAKRDQKPVVIEVDAQGRYKRLVGDLPLNEGVARVLSALKQNNFATEIVHPEDPVRYVRYHQTGAEVINRPDVVRADITDRAFEKVKDPLTGFSVSGLFRTEKKADGSIVLHQITLLDAAKAQRLSILQSRKDVIIHNYDPLTGTDAPELFTTEEYKDAGLRVKRVYTPLFQVYFDPETGGITQRAKHSVMDLVVDPVTKKTRVVEYLADDPTFRVETVRDLGEVADGPNSVILRVHKGGKAYLGQYDTRTGRKEADFYPAPHSDRKIVGGREVIREFRGTVAVDKEETATFALSPGTRRDQGYDGTEPVQRFYYYDENYKPADAVGYAVETAKRLNIGGIKNTDVKGTERTDRDGNLNWIVLEELDNDGRFVRARGVDNAGNERARIGALSDRTYLANFVKENTRPGDAVPDEYSFSATLDRGAYRLGRDEIKAVYENPFVLNLAEDTEADIDRVLRAIPDFDKMSPTAKRMAAKKFGEGLQNIVKDFEVLGPRITLTNTRVEMSNGGVTFHTRVKGDPHARVLVFRSSDINANVVVNTDWVEGYAKIGYEFSTSLGRIYLLESDPALENAEELAKDLKLNPRVIEKLKKYGVSIDRSIQFIKVNKYELVDGQDSKRILSQVSYQLGRNPLGEKYAVLQGSEVRFIRNHEAAITGRNREKAPFGISPGEVVVEMREVKDVTRVTSYAETRTVRSPIDDKDEKVIVYKMDYFFREGRAPRNRNVEIESNLRTAVVAERHLDEGWVSYTKDGYPIYKDQIGSDGKWYRHSDFDTLVYQARENGQDVFYVLNWEKQVTKTPIGGKQNLVWRNDQKLGIEKNEGLTTQTREFYIITNPFSERGLNSTAYRAWKFIDTVVHAGGRVFGRDIHFNPRLRFLGFDLDWRKQEKLVGELDLAKNKGVLLFEISQEQKELREKQPVYFNWLRYAESWSWLAILAAIFSIPWAVTLKNRRVPRRFARAQTANVNDPGFTFEGTRLAATAQEIKAVDQIRQNLLYYGPFVLSPVVKDPTDQERILRGYFSGDKGFSDEDRNVIVRLFKEGRIAFKEAAPNPWLGQKVPPMINRWSNDPAARPDGFYTSQIASAVGSNYRRARAIQELVDKGALSEEDLAEAATTISFFNFRPRGLRWQNLYKILINKAQNKVLAKIQETSAEEFNPGDLDLLPPTPEANVLKYIIRNNVLPLGKVLDEAKNYPTLTEFVNGLVRREIIGPVFGAIERLYADKVTYEDSNNLFDTVCANVKPAIFSDPSILSTWKTTGDITHNPYPMQGAIEARTLREAAILKFLQLNHSQANGQALGNDAEKTKLYGAGQMSIFWAFMMYLVREVDHDLQQGSDNAAILGKIDDHLLVFKTVLDREVKLKHVGGITGRKDIWNMPPEDLKLVDLFYDEDMTRLFKYLYILNQQKKTDETIGQLTHVNIHEAAEDIRKTAKTMAAQNAVLDNLAAKFKDAMLRLKNQVHPETAKAERETGVPSQLGRSIAKTGAVLVAAAAAIVFTPFVSIGSYAFITGVAFILFGLFNLKGIGLIPFYMARLVKNILSPSFWGIRHPVYYGLMVSTLVGLGVTGFLMTPYVTASVFFVTTALTLPQILFGNFRSAGEQRRWVFITMATNGFVSGILVHHLLWKFALMEPTIGLVLTLAVLSVVYLPTVLSFFHVSNFMKGIEAFQNETWSRTARSLMGLGSLDPRGIDQSWFWKRKYAEWFDEINEVLENYDLGMNGFVIPNGQSPREYLTSLVSILSELKSGTPSGFGMSQEERTLWLKKLNNQPGGEFRKPKSEIAHRILYSAFMAMSQRNPVPSPLMLIQATTSRIAGAGERYTHTESDLFLGSYDSSPNRKEAKLVAQIDSLIGADPAAALKPFQADGLKDKFVDTTLFNKYKGTQGKIALLENLLALSAVVKAGSDPDKTRHLDRLDNQIHALRKSLGIRNAFIGEIQRVKDETAEEIRSRVKELREVLSDKRKSSLFAYMAVTHKAEYANLIEQLQMARNLSPALLDDLRELKDKEWTDIHKLLFVDHKNDATDEDRAFVIRAMVEWLNFLRPSDRNVMDSMARDYTEYHLYISHEMGDLVYNEAVNYLSRLYKSVPEAFVAIQNAENRSACLGQMVGMVKESLGLSDDQAKGRAEALLEAFNNNYRRYHELARQNVRPVYQNLALWSTGDFSVSAQGRFTSSKSLNDTINSLDSNKTTDSIKKTQIQSIRKGLEDFK
ncbi:MAG: hypothetical protein HYT89_06350, partial [Candidatus Omnitrophica bacterium]|nr:hypothetical protein [Candidatus Omnitrophota bacterium]